MAFSTLASPFLPTLSTPNPKTKPLSLCVPAWHAVSPWPPPRLFRALPAAARERHRFLERYGLNPDDFEDDVEADPREESRGRQRRRSERREEAAEPQETHNLLQVLDGKVRRRKLISPNDRNVRPMMEVVRGAAFDILQSAGGSPASLRPGWWLDLYSGTGSVGIEAMSGPK